MKLLVVLAGLSVGGSSAVTIDKQKFIFYKSAKTWTEAEKACVDQGMHLASLHSESQLKQITEYVSTRKMS